MATIINLPEIQVSNSISSGSVSSSIGVVVVGVTVVVIY